MTKKIIILSAITILLGIANVSHAQTPTNSQNRPDQNSATSSQNYTDNPHEINQLGLRDDGPRAMTWNIFAATMGFIAYFSIFLIIFGIIKWVLNRKDKARRKKGFKIFLIGLVLLFITTTVYGIAEFYTKSPAYLP